MAGESNARAQRVTGELAPVRLPADVAALTQEIDRLGRELDADLRGRLAEARQPYVTEIHALLALLAPWHGLAALPPLVPAAPAGALRDRFPTGFAQDYVDDLLGSVDDSRTLTTQTADGAGVRTPDESDVAKVLVGDLLPEDLRDEALRLLQDDTCHAMERHGHHIDPETQLARLVWLKDPAGEEVWRLQPNGSVESEHWCGPMSGGFTSPEAMAKPLAVFLRWAHDRAGGVNELIEKHTTSTTNRLGIHISAELAGLVAGDAAGYRGTATGSPEQIADWRAARRHAMRNGAPPVYGVPYDPIAAGQQAGVVLAFKRAGPTDWHLVTCYPVEDFNPKNERLEDLT
ncbi:hypothetical protein [Jiangella alkaliphila]|uniref:hypothetical protein n=1 Tax=Jiangella alkaliphila TaxID=419479 RepID=UPI00128D14D7|nr:hypothetical protein [Jiangella alkaliphila]